MKTKTNKFMHKLIALFLIAFALFACVSLLWSMLEFSTKILIKKRSKTTEITQEHKKSYLEFKRTALLEEIESIDLELNEINTNEQNK